jgi:predicted dehydrogenase
MSSGRDSLGTPPIVIIGAGAIVRSAHLPAYRKAGFVVAGLYDIDPARAEALARDFTLPRVYGSLEEAVAAEPAVFDVAVPASAFLPILRSLPDGAAVLLQKPMGEDLMHARRIRDLCRRKRLRAAVNFQLRYAPNVVEARRLIASGAIGDLHDIEVRVTVNTPWEIWTFLESLPRVEILYHSIHYIDMVRSFFGDPQGVYAKTLKHPAAPKLASTRSAILLDYGELRRATITANHGHRFGPSHQESYAKWEGTRGAIKARLGVLLNYPTGVEDTLEYTAGGAEWTAVPLAGRWFPDAFAGSMASLLAWVRDPACVPPTVFEDAYRTMAVVEAAYRSSARGGTPVPK